MGVANAFTDKVDMICNFRVDVDEVVGSDKNSALDEGSLSPKFWIYDWVNMLIIALSYLNLNLNHT